MFSYIKSEDHFFYTLVYDAANKALFEDRGEIKIGHQYQVPVQYSYQVLGMGSEQFIEIHMIQKRFGTF